MLALSSVMVASLLAQSVEPGIDRLGNLTYNIPIEVPEFHLIAPDLTLTYNSGRGLGWAGRGWDLGCLSRIEQVSPGGGLPDFSGSDEFLLDGQRMRACPTATPSLSASCTSGGTHELLSDDGSRIQHEGADWYVTTPDGVRRRYVEGQLHAWILESVSDAHGNRVEYSYMGMGGSDVDYLTAISYGNASSSALDTQILFSYQNVGRTQRFASGSAVLGRNDFKPISIELRHHGVRIGAISLSYFDGMLSSVQRFGADAALGAWGQVLGGSSLPAVSLAYGANGRSDSTHDWTVFPQNNPSDSSLLLQAPAASGSILPITATDEGTNRLNWYPLDLDGDGRAELLGSRVLADGSVVLTTIFADGSATESTTPWNVGAIVSEERAPYHVLPANLNGDRFPDLILLCDGSGPTPSIVAKVALGSGGGFIYSSQATEVVSGSWLNVPNYGQTVPLVGDVNGDGLADLTLVRPLDPWTQNFDFAFYTATSDGNGLLLRDIQVPMPGECAAKGFCANRMMMSLVRSGDFNGDGLLDFGLAVPGNVTGCTGASCTFALGSCYSDSNADMLTFLSARDGAILGTWAVGPVWCAPMFEDNGQFPVYAQNSLSMMTTGDFDGDGRTDWFLVRPNDAAPATGTPQYSLALSRGQGQFEGRAGSLPQVSASGINYFPGAILGGLGSADLDRDGIDDILISTPFNSNNQQHQNDALDILWIRGSHDGMQFESPVLVDTVPWGAHYYGANSLSPLWSILPADWGGNGGNLELAYVGIAGTDPWNPHLYLRTASLDANISTSPGDVLLLDADGDGRNEFVRVRRDADGARIDWRRVSDQATDDPVQSHVLLSPVAAGNWEIHGLDLDGLTCSAGLCQVTGSPDGRTDLVFLFRDDQDRLAIKIAISKGDGSFDDSRATEFAGNLGGLSFGGWAEIDADGDGSPDLGRVLPARALVSHSIQLLRRQGGVWTLSTDTIPNEGAVISWRAGNVNADYPEELFLVIKGSNESLKIETVRFLGGAWSPFAVFPVPAALAADSQGNQWVVGDLNGDGVTDLAQVSVRSTSDAVVDMLYGTGNGGFEWESAAVSTLGGLSRVQRWQPVSTRPGEDAEFQALLPPEMTDYSSLPGSVARIWRTAAGTWAAQAVSSFCSDSSCSGSISVDGIRPRFRLDTDNDGLPEYVALRWAGDGLGLGGIRVLVQDVPDGRPLLGGINNGLGYTASIVYGTSGGHHAGYIPGIVRHVVSGVTEVIGPGPNQSSPPPPIVHGSQTIERTYAWDGLRYDYARRELVGFERLDEHVVESSSIGHSWAYDLRMRWSRGPCQGRLTSTGGSVYPQDFEEDIVLWKNRGGSVEPYEHCVVYQSYVAIGGTPAKMIRSFEHDKYGNQIFEEATGGVGATAYSVHWYFADPGTSYVANLPWREEVTDENGNLLSRTQHDYDNLGVGTAPIRGDPTSELRWDDEHGADVVTERTFDGFGNIRSETSPEKRAKSYDYDTLQRDQLRRVCIDSLCMDTTASNYPFSAPETVQDPNGVTVTYSYDVFGRRTRELWSNGECTDYRYLSYGTPQQRDVVDVCDSSGNDGPQNMLKTDSYFDGLHRPWRLVRASGAWQERAYYGRGTTPAAASSWASAAQGSPWTFIYRDARGHEYSRVFPDGSEVRTERAGLMTRTHDQTQKTHEVYVNGWDSVQLFREFLAGGTVDTQYEYDWAGRVTAMTDQRGNKTKYSWSTTGVRLEACDPARGCIAYDNDKDGLLLHSLDGNGDHLNFTYDSLGRMTLRTSSRGDRDVWTWDEDPAVPSAAYSRGRLVSTNTVNDAREEFSYDPRGRVAATTRCYGSTCGGLEYVYDVSGLLQYIVYPDPTGKPGGEVVEQRFDLDGQVSSVDGYAPVVRIDAAGRVEEIQFQNGVTQSWVYNTKRDWLDEIRVASPGGAVLLGMSFKYMPDGRLRWRSIQNSTGTTSSEFDYDDLARLTKDTDTKAGAKEEFSYDEVGNITYSDSQGIFDYSFAGLPYSITSTGAGDFRYDGIGSSWRTPSADYEWDAKGQLLWTGTDKGDTVRFDYLVDGSRIIKSSVATENFYFDRRLERRNGRYVNLIYVGGHALAERDGSGVVYFHAGDRGEVRLATTGSASVSAEAEYSAYGEKTGTGQVNLGLGGHHYDSETNLVYMGARYLDPRLGRFLSADTVEPTPNPASLPLKSLDAIPTA